MMNLRPKRLLYLKYNIKVKIKGGKGTNMNLKNLNKTKLLITGLAVGAMLTSTVSCRPIITSLVKSDDNDDRTEPEFANELVVSSDELEGEGYESPEKAVEAYLNYLKNEDIKGAMSTFAVESYVDNYDIEEYYNYAQSFSAFIVNGAQTYAGFYSDSVASRDMNIEARRSYIYSGIHDQIMQIMLDKTDEDKIVENYYYKKTFAEGKISTENVMNFLSIDPALDSIVIGDFLSVEDFDVQPDFLKIALDSKEKCWSSDVEAVTVEVNISGKDYTLFMLCVCYDEKWYIAEFSNVIAQNLGIIRGKGLVPSDEIGR